MVEIPDIVQLQGIGEFTSGDSSFKSDFQLIQYPAKTVLLSSVPPSSFDSVGPPFVGNDFWILNGILEDNRPITCDSLLASFTIKSTYEFRFTPFNTKIEIGEKLKPPIKEATFPLVAFYEGPFTLQDDGWKISTQQGSLDPRSLQSMSDLWHVPMEGMILKLSHADATIEQYQEKAVELATLLSLASGNIVMFHRQIFHSETNLEFEIWRRGKGGLGIGSGLIYYGSYLKEVLPTWRSMAPEDQKLIRIATTYLNGSAHGYMEDKLLNITIAWEMLANAWIPSESRPSEEITELKSALKKAYREWRKNHPGLDDSGFLGGRISQALDWEKVIKKIEQLANDFDIDSNLVGTNFRRLVTIRNRVAHDGVLPQENYSDEASHPLLKLLLSSQFALRVLLLKKLDYTGLISSAKDGWRTFMNISEAEFDFQ